MPKPSSSCHLNDAVYFFNRWKYNIQLDIYFKETCLSDYK